MFVFFFKQKTAYEMRISDWSSDVCSSDLSAGRLELDAGFILFAPGGQQRIAGECRTRAGQEGGRIADIGRDADHRFIDRADAPGESVGVAVYHAIAEVAHDRSEEHTSELQSLMRISYAVFCLKKKIQKRSDNV